MPNDQHARKPAKTNSFCWALVTYKLQTSFSVLVQPDNHVVQKFDTWKIYQLSNEVIFFRAPFCLFLPFYFGVVRSKWFMTLRNVSKFTFFDKIGHAKSVGFWFYSAIWRSESRISLRYLEITLISLINSLTFSRKKELLFWLSWDLNQLTCVTRQIRGDSKLRD